MHVPELRTIRILADMSSSQLDALSNYGEVLRLSAGEAIVRQGDPADAMFLLLDGKVGAYVTDPKGNETHLRTIESGGHFGEIGLLEHGRRTASLRTMTPCQVFRLDASAFGELLKAPDLAVHFLHGLSRSLALRLADITSRFADARSFKEAWML
jgi:CRP/FNR family transcriptional regulator, cyclic AMP receptor protein